MTCCRRTRIHRHYYGTRSTSTLLSMAEEKMSTKANKLCTFVDMFYSVIGNDAGAEHCPEYLHLRLHITRIDGSSIPFAIAHVWNTRRRLGLLPDSGVCSCHFGCWNGRLASTPRRFLYWMCIILPTHAFVFPIISPLTLTERSRKTHLNTRSFT